MVSPMVALKTQKSASIVSRALSRVLLDIPSSKEVRAADPLSRSRHLRTAAAKKAAKISAALALPPGPAGLLTIVPDLMAIWRVQSSLVADIASTYGQRATLTKESMVYCLFKHGGAALVRDLLVRVGERVVIRGTTVRVMQQMLSRIGVHVSQRVVGRAVSRWVPVAGAIGVGAYAYFDTKKVGDNAIELFSSDVTLAPDDESRTTISS